jgi:hypothetical protein
LIEPNGAITSQPITAVPFNNNCVLSGSKDKKAILWNFKNCAVMQKLSGFKDFILTVAIAFDRNVAIYGL